MEKMATVSYSNPNQARVLEVAKKVKALREEGGLKVKLIRSEYRKTSIGEFYTLLFHVAEEHREQFHQLIGPEPANFTLKDLIP